ncbi:salicylate hydroxylase [Xylogone sp. PMI_703]|nr:salicylate hydroxylase [Xylogone sp. PMI_703]
MPKPKMHVGIIGAGLGGLTAAIAIARAGAQVTILEATKELGEIGAGIQVFGNVSRFLIRWGVDHIIGDDLVRPVEYNCWGADGPHKLIGYINMLRMEREQGFPWWVVRRDHLHAGLSKSAQQHGVQTILGARVASLRYNENEVSVTTDKSVEYIFDLVIGADGIKSTTRQALFPELVPRAISNIAAYRAVIDYEEVYAKVPEARSVLRNTVDAWAGPKGYVLLYPLSGGKELNVVTAFITDHLVSTVEDVDIDEFREYYKEFPPFVGKILKLMKATKRWPLLVVPPTKTWSNEHKNVVLLGDAIHGMQNHMAQGAATAMEDGVFLGRIISETLRGAIDLREGITLYEKQRIPKAWMKAQAAFINGELNTLSGEEQDRRNSASSVEIVARDRNPLHPDSLPPTYRPWQLFASPQTVPGILGYDAETDADIAVCEYLQSKGDVDPVTMVSAHLRKKWWNTIYDNGIDMHKPKGAGRSVL